MKNSLIKVWGVVLALAMLAGLLVAAVPVSAANLAWTANGMPSSITTTEVIGSWVLSVGADGKTMLAYDVSNVKLYRSVDGGVKFTTAAAANGIDGAPITDMKLASDNVTAIATDGADVYVSTNAGVSWIKLTPSGTAAVGVINAVDCAPGNIFVAGGTDGWSIFKSSGLGTNWSAVKTAVVTGANLLTDQDIVGIALAPNYTTNPLVIMVTASATDTYVRFAYGDTAIGTLYADQKIAGVSTNAVIGFPSDFATNFLVGSEAGLWKVGIVGYSTNPELAVAPGNKISTAAVDTLSFDGTWAAGTAYFTADAAVQRISGVAAVANTTSAVNSAGVTGTLTYVAATADKVYVLSAGDGGALNVSSDKGATFVQTNLIQVVGFAVESITFADANTIFTVGNDGGLYKSVDAGATWQRIQYGGSSFVKAYASPAYATDNTIYVSTETPLTWKSVDGGKTMSPFISAGIVTDMAIIDANTYYYAAGGSIYKNTNMFAALTGAAAVNKIAYVNPTLIYAGTTNGNVLKSVDGATFAAVTTTAPFTGNVVVVADAANLYAASDVAGEGVKKLAGTAWVSAGSDIAPVTTPPTATIFSAAKIVGLAINADGTVYAIDSISGKVFRNADGATFENVAYPVANGAPLAAKVFGTTIYVNSATAMANFTDTLSAAPVFTSPGTGAAALLDVNTAKLTWNAVPGATQYTFKVAGTADMTSSVLVAPTAQAANSVFLPSAMNLINGETYYATIQVTAPYRSKVSAVASFQTKLTSAGTDLTKIMAPAAGASVTQKTPTFNWTAVANATSYDFKLSDKADFSTTVDSTIGLTTTVYTTGVTLKEGTTYYWQVRAVNGTNASDWVQSTFNVVAPPSTAVAPTPVINVPTPVVNIPPATVVVNNPTPVVTVQPASTTTPPWVWVIIVIGAVLVVAVIVLIARTRRV